MINVGAKVRLTVKDEDTIKLTKRATIIVIDDDDSKIFSPYTSI